MNDEVVVSPNNSLQADKGKPSRHLRAHMARQLAVSAELSRWADDPGGQRAIP